MKNLFVIFLLSITCAHADSIFNQQNQNGDGSLTLEEERQAEGYVHEGLAQERLQEICTGNNSDSATSASNDHQDICSNGDKAWGSGAMGMVETMMPIVTKAYSAIGVAGLMGGGGGMDFLSLKGTAKKNGHPVLTDEDGNEFEANKSGVYKDSDGNPISEQNQQEMDQKKENKKDYCAVIPGITDMAATTMQTMDNQQIQNGMQNPQQMSEGSPARQAQAFYAMSRSHEARAKSSTVQAAGWGGTAACYAIKASTGYSSWSDPATLVKLGLSTAVGVFYMAKRKAHKDKAELLKKLGDSFPGAGDCNPHTDTQCFCAQESSMATDMANFQKYCVPLQFGDRLGDDGFPVPCVDAEGKSDPECKCKKRRSCIDTTLTQDAVRVGLNPSVMRGAGQNLTPLANGLAGSGLGPGIEEQLAIAKKQLKKFGPRNGPNLRGKPKAQKMAKKLQDLGIPAGTARLIASANIPVNGATGLPALAAAGLNNDTLGSGNNAFKTRSAPRLKSGGSAGNKFRKGGSSNPFGSKKKRGGGGLQIQGDMSKLANKATIDADINKDNGRGIFEILSHRYKMRAWKEFEGSMQTEQE